jgi:hypothetical protein
MMLRYNNDYDYQAAGARYLTTSKFFFHPYRALMFGPHIRPPSMPTPQFCAVESR